MTPGPQKYVFKAYSRGFPELFEKEKERIISCLKKGLSIEHVGSTAVPNLGGKGIIDIAIGVNREDRDQVCQQLQEMGYELRLPHSTPARLFLRADLPDFEDSIRRYHIHLMLLISKEWRDMIAFRDYLRTHPIEMQHYAEVKKQAAAAVCEDGVKYRELKGPVFNRVLEMIEKNHEDGGL